MLRFLGIATLVLVVVCLALGASIALADTGDPQAAAVKERTIEAVDPDRRMIASIGSGKASGPNLQTAASAAEASDKRQPPRPSPAG